MGWRGADPRETRQCHERQDQRAEILTRVLAPPAAVAIRRMRPITASSTHRRDTLSPTSFG
jgi:hypothetical protein